MCVPSGVRRLYEPVADNDLPSVPGSAERSLQRCVTFTCFTVFGYLLTLLIPTEWGRSASHSSTPPSRANSQGAATSEMIAHARLRSAGNFTMCRAHGRTYQVGHVLQDVPQSTSGCRRCTCTSAGEWGCRTRRPAAHSIARGTRRYAETLGFIAAWMHLKLQGTRPGETYADNELMQWLMQHGLWFHQTHRSSWVLPWHRLYLYEVEGLLLQAWTEIRCKPHTLAQYGWPTTPDGSIVFNANHTDADGVTSYVDDPCSLCVAVPYWHHARDAGKRPRDWRMAPLDPYTFGGSGFDSEDGCFDASQFGRARYAIGDWGIPQRMLPNGKAHAGYWGSKGRCLRRPYSPTHVTDFLNEREMQELLKMCSPWVEWQASFERLVHDPAHDFIKGHMSTPISALDPIFWLHHAGLDRGWTVWQRNCDGAGSSTRRCGSESIPLGYQTKSPDISKWSPTEDPSWAKRHAGEKTRIFDDCGRVGCSVSGVNQTVSFRFRMPECTLIDETQGDDHSNCVGYSHECTAPLEPFYSWPTSPSRPSSYATPASVLDSARFGHTCTGPEGERRCAGVEYEDPLSA